MGTRHELQNCVVVVKPYRKSGNGGKGGGRKGNSGKRGFIYRVNPDSSRTELATEEGTTWKDLSRKLRATNLIPHHVSLNSSGETSF